MTNWILPPLLAVLWCVATAAYSRRTRPAAASLMLQGMMIAVALYSLMQALALAFTSLTAQLWFCKLQYPAVLGASVAWFLFALRYTGRSPRTSSQWGPLLVLIAAVITGLVFTNDWHGLVWADIQQVRSGALLSLSLEHGPVFYLHAIYCYGLMLAATAVLVWTVGQTYHTRKQLVAIVGGPALVVVATILYLSPLSPGVWFDFIPLGYAFAGSLLAWGLMRSGAADLVPVARNQAFESIGDAVFVLDDEGRILDFNPAGAAIFGPATHAAIGRSFSDLARAPALEHVLDLGIAEVQDVTMGPGLDERVYDLRVSPIHSPSSGALMGRVLVFRETTDRRRIEAGLRVVTASLEEANTELERLANSDTLTGLSSRRYFLQQLERECRRSQRHGHDFALMLLDLDHFKEVNDAFGHQVGDEVLVATARAVRSVAREVDVTGRIGGEEFAILLPETDLEGASALAERIRTEVADARHTDPDQKPFRVTISIGITTWGMGRDTPSELLRAADRALYAAKRSGRNRVVRAAPSAAPGEPTLADIA
ncbi:MAG: diguanylate cyclase [Gemmatimonadota bacterium]|nr:diguanylate cyclase [Gemmatimonadota bacterium]